MTPPRKRVTLTAMAADTQAALREVFVAQPMAWVDRARARLRDLPKTNFDLGAGFMAQEKWFDALFRFRVTLFFQPNYPNTWYSIGCCYFRMGRTAQARAALLKALKQDPGHADANFMLAVIDPAALPANQRPERIPAEMVKGFFSSVAEGYDIAESKHRYQAGKIIFDLVHPLLKAPAQAVLDLACGSGIAARPWRATTGTMTGVDLTPAMLKLAEKANHAEKKLFDTLLEADVTQLPDTITPASFDVVLWVNAAQFIGDLSSTLHRASQALMDDGLLVLTIEPHTALTGFGLNADTGRFGHSIAYVTQTANAAGLTLIKESTVDLYAATPAQALVFTKGKN